MISMCEEVIAYLLMKGFIDCPKIMSKNKKGNDQGKGPYCWLNYTSTTRCGIWANIGAELPLLTIGLVHGG